MEKRTQPRLEWTQRSYGWTANASDDVIIHVTDIMIHVYVNNLLMVVVRRARVSSTDLVDAMLFAEDRARELCRTMFGKLLEVDSGH